MITIRVLKSESTVARTFKKCMEGLYDDYKGSNKKVFLVATAESVDRLPPAILACFKEQVNFEVSWIPISIRSLFIPYLSRFRMNTKGVFCC